MTNHKPVAVITGGSGYLGGAITTKLLASGWSVISLSRKPSSNTSVESYLCDISNESEVKEVTRTLLEKYHQVNALIHTSTPPLIRKPILDISTQAFEDDFKTSILGAFFFMKSFKPYMDKGSAFIAITSEAIEKTSVKNLGSYISTKQALHGFLQTLSRELDPQNIRIYAVAPGFLPGGLNNDLPKAFLDSISNQRTPSAIERVSSLVTDLCVNTSKYKSGTSINVSTDKVSPL